MRVPAGRMGGSFAALLLALSPAWSASRAQAQASSGPASELVERARLSRSSRESVFLGASVGLRYRSLVYAEDAAEGPDGRGELRVLVNGRYGLGRGSPLGAAVDLGFVGTAFVPAGPIGDSLASPYDGFDFTRNVRLLGAQLEYRVFGEARGERLSLQAGRLSELELRRGLVLYDGGRARLSLAPGLRLSAYAGRRALLDGERPDGRDALGAVLIAGGQLEAVWGLLGATLAYRFEEVHRPSLRLALDPSELITLGLGGELTLGGREAVGIDGAPAADGPAGRLRVDGRLSTASYRSALGFVTELQLGQDPVSYGRGGRGPSRDELELAARAPISAARLDRLFFGPSPAHLYLDVLAEHWFLDELGVNAGLYGFIPLAEAEHANFRPQVIELYAGPELALGSGLRAGLEGRASFQDPGTTGQVFQLVGAGEQTRLAGRVYAELPLRLGDELVLSARPEVEVSSWSAKSALARVENQAGAAFGLIATLRASLDWRVSVRYGGELLPRVVADGVDYLHDFELWLGGTF